MFPTPSPEILTPSTSNSYRPPENEGADEKNVIVKLEENDEKSNAKPNRKNTMKKLMIIDYDSHRHSMKSGLRPKINSVSSPKSNAFENKNNAKITDFFGKRRIAKEGENNFEIQVKEKKQASNDQEKSEKTSEVVLKEEIRRLNKKIDDKENIIQENVKKLTEIEQSNLRLNDKVGFYQNSLENLTGKSKDFICKMLLETEALRRREKISNLFLQKQKLGDFIAQREGHKFVDIWIDGHEIKEIKNEILRIQREKEELEKKKKGLNKQSASNGILKKGGESNMFIDSLNSEEISGSAAEMKNHINFQLFFLQREEYRLQEKLYLLDKEKVTYIAEWKKYTEEQNCRFSKKDLETGLSPWPLINDRYQLLCLLGKGGFSEVYKAFDIQDYKLIALKVHQLSASWSEHVKQQYIKHALRETAIHMTLKHPNIVRLFETIEIDQNTLGTVLEFCDGRDLSMVVKEGGKGGMGEKEAKMFLKEIMMGLKYLHEHKKKIIHYDLKPQNILFHQGLLKITDFGLCKVVEDNASRLELTSQGVGTYWYLPPECFEMGDSPPQINTSLDIWSLGVIFYEMLYGEKPFGNNMSQDKIMKEQIILNAEGVKFPDKKSVSNDAKEFIKKCLMKNPNKRWNINEALESSYIKNNK